MTMHFFVFPILLRFIQSRHHNFLYNVNLLVLQEAPQVYIYTWFQYLETYSPKKKKEITYSIQPGSNNRDLMVIFFTMQ